MVCAIVCVLFIFNGIGNLLLNYALHLNPSQGLIHMMKSVPHYRKVTPTQWLLTKDIMPNGEEGN